MVESCDSDDNITLERYGIIWTVIKSMKTSRISY